MDSLRFLCRGKRKEDGEWFFGVPLRLGDYTLIVDGPIDFDEDFCQLEYWWAIDPDTLGQSTGLLAAKSYRGDGERERITFEGDIVRCSRGCPHEVIWLQEYGGRNMLDIGGMPAFYLSGLLPGYAWTGSEEIIGNRWDHPELMGGVANGTT